MTAVGYLDQILAKRQWAAGDRFTVADIALAVDVCLLESYEFECQEFDHVFNWYQAAQDELMSFGWQVR